MARIVRRHYCVMTRIDITPYRHKVSRIVIVSNDSHVTCRTSSGPSFRNAVAAALSRELPPRRPSSNHWRKEDS
jgi:hypothetical protein